MHHHHLLPRFRTPVFCLLFLTLLFCSSSQKPKTPALTSILASAEESAPQNPPLPPKESPSQKMAEPDSLFRFAVYGDTRSDPLHGSGPHQVHRQIVTQVLTFHPALVLQTGDLVFSGSNLGQWRLFDEITAEMRKTVAYYPARGNHDFEKQGDNFQKRVTQPTLSGNRLYYAFEKENVHFIALDTEQSLNEKDAQYKWLEDDLKKAKAANKFIIPFFHRALFSIGPHGSDATLQAILHPLFKKYGVKLVFQGHDHHYYHTKRDGITYIVTGGGGAPLYNADNRNFGIAGDAFEKAHHFCMADVYKDKVVITVYRRDLTQIESFSVAVA